MKAEKLLKRLSEKGYKFHYIGARDEEIYGVTPWTVGTDGKNILQISTGNIDSASQAAGVMVLSEADDAPVVLSYLQSWLIEDIKQQEELETLRLAIAQNCSLYEVIRLCSRALQSPAILLDQNLSILVQYPAGILTETAKRILLCQVLNWQYEYSHTARHAVMDDCVIHMLVYNGESYYLAILAESDISRRTQFHEILERILSLFDAANSCTSIDSMEKILRSLLLRRFTLTEHDRSRMRNLGWVDQEKYYILLIDRPFGTTDDNFRKQIQILIGSPVYSIDHRYVAILWSDKYLELTEKHFPELNHYLIDCNSLASLSFGFFDLADAPAYFEQCNCCMKSAVKQGYRGGVWGVSRFHLSVLMQLLPPDNTVDLRQFCHPTILLLYDIDRNEDTSYLDTLFTYIVSGRSVKRTAVAMDLHVNTIYTRITKLQERFHIDFNDDHLMYTLHNSINLINIYYDPNALNSGFPFLR